MSRPSGCRWVFGALPYVTLGPWEIGPLTLHSFGLLVGIGVLLAHRTAMRRSETLGVSGALMNRALSYMLLSGFVGAHIFAVLFYEPEKVLSDPLSLLRLWESMSSYGGLLGALIGLALFRVRQPEAPLDRIVDAAAFALPIGWLFGRLGCSLAHDHPGRVTDFFLAVDFGAHYPGGVRHDLGFYEAMWWVVIVLLFFALDRARPALRQRRWFYPGLLAVTYSPVRLLLDFLRAGVEQGGDARYFGLTPAQYISAIMMVLGVGLLVRRSRPRPAPTAIA